MARARDRYDAVRAHHQVGGGRLTACEPDRGPVGVLVEPYHLAPEVIPAGVESGQQVAVEGVPRADAVVHPLLVTDGAAPVEETQPGKLDHHSGQIQRPVFLEVADRDRMEGNAGAAALELRGRTLEHIDLASEVAQHQRRGEAAHRSAYDGHLGRVSNTPAGCRSLMKCLVSGGAGQ